MFKSEADFFNTKISSLNFNPKFFMWYNIIILTSSCNTRSRILKALSVVHPTYSEINLKMALQFGPKHVAEL